MLHVFKIVLAKSVASSREISGRPCSERNRALTKTARATLISGVCAMSVAISAAGEYRDINEERKCLREIKERGFSETDWLTKVSVGESRAHCTSQCLREGSHILYFAKFDRGRQFTG